MRKLWLNVPVVAALFLNVGSNGATLKDKRDGQTYRTVTIGSQTWMAENLNYKTWNSYCYKDNPANCVKYGRLYTWTAAEDACPKGWHLPSRREWAALLDAVGGFDTAGTKLKSSSGWNDYEGESGNGIDAYFFSVLPAGYRYDDGNYFGEGSVVYFWSSTEASSDYAGSVALYSVMDFADPSLTSYISLGFSVRCLKD